MASGICSIPIHPLHQNILLYRLEASGAILYESLKFLPVDYATVIRMYLEGWKTEEIATKLGLTLQTVYNKRQEAIVILRKYMMK